MHNTALNMQSTSTHPSLLIAPRLGSLQYLPQAVFLLARDRTLLEMNAHAEHAIADNWVSVSNRKLHFQDTRNDRNVDRAMEQLFSPQKSNNEPASSHRRLALKSKDSKYRGYILARESEFTDDVILTIQGELAGIATKINSVANAFRLSRCETKVLVLMVRGLKPKEIAYEAFISLNTVRSHLRAIYAKMQVRDYSEALTLTTRLLM